MSNVLMFPVQPDAIVVKELRACAIEEEAESGVEELHKQYTLLLLRRYFRMSIDMGRLPTILGRREFFRAKASSYRVHSFEDAVIFVHDMERSLAKLDDMSQRMIAGVVFLEYSRKEIAEALGIYRTTVANRFERALEELARLLVEQGMITNNDLRRVRPRSGRERGNVQSFPAKKPCGSASVGGYEPARTRPSKNEKKEGA